MVTFTGTLSHACACCGFFLTVVSSHSLYETMRII